LDVTANRIDLTDEGQSTRQQIVNLLRREGELTANALANYLDITAMGVRRHLTNLERDGLVVSRLVRQRVGRPTYVYSLSASADDLFPKNYHLFTLNLLADIEENEGQEKVQTLFERQMRRLENQIRPRLAGKDLAGRVAEIARARDEAGYMATWSETDEGWLLRERNCALLRIAEQYPLACYFELELFRRLLPDAEVVRQHAIANGETACVYLVRPIKEKAPHLNPEQTMQG